MNIQSFTIVKLAFILLLVGCADQLPPDIAANTQEVAKIRTALEAGATEGSSDTEELAGPSGYVTLKGRFTLNGDAPALTPLTITKEASVCAPGGKTVYAQDVVVDPDTKGIANIVLYADKVPEAWVHESAMNPAEPEVVFDQKECVFLTHVVAMQTSQTLLVKNSDPVGHNLMVKSFNEIIPPGKSTTMTTRKQDVIPVKMSCSIHPWMTAYFIGRDDGYFAVTAKDGSFEIPNVPAGVKLTFRVWHERIGAISGSVNVNGSPQKWKKGKFSQTFDAASPPELNVELNAADFTKKK